MDVPKPPQYIEDLPEGPPNIPGGFDVFQRDQYTDPWRDQAARMLKQYPVLLTSASAAAATQTEMFQEPPLWYLLCIQVTSTVINASNSLTEIVITMREGQGESIELRPTPGYLTAFNGATVDNYSFYGPVLRYITKANSRQVTLALTSNIVTVNTLAKGTLFLIGAGVDPTKVGVF